MSLIFVAFFNRASAFYVLTSFYIINIVVVFMKMVYVDGRPYMMDPTLDASRACSDTSFGNPSGHTARALSLFVLQYMEFFNKESVQGIEEKMQNQASAPPTGTSLYD